MYLLFIALIRFILLNSDTFSLLSKHVLQVVLSSSQLEKQRPLQWQLKKNNLKGVYRHIHTNRHTHCVQMLQLLSQLKQYGFVLSVMFIGYNFIICWLLINNLNLFWLNI